MFPVKAMPLLQLSLAVLGLSQNRLCFLHSKEPMTEQPIVPVPFLLACHPNIEKDEKNPTLLYFAFHHCPHISSKGAFPQQIITSFPRLTTQFTYWINLYLPPKKIISCRENIGASPPQKSFNFRRYFQSPDLFPPFSIFLCL